MRFSMIIFFAEATYRFWYQEVVKRGASNTFVSDCNIHNENKHPKRFKSMRISEISYSKVKSFKIPSVSSLVFLPPTSLPVTSHRRISLLTDKRPVLCGQKMWQS